MNTPIVTHPVLTNVKCVINSQQAAIELGKWDAQHGAPCQPDAYAYPNDARRSYLRGDYVYAYIQARGL